jgi:hypothetical protein
MVTKKQLQARIDVKDADIRDMWKHNNELKELLKKEQEKTQNLEWEISYKNPKVDRDRLAATILFGEASNEAKAQVLLDIYDIHNLKRGKSSLKWEY